jgi:MFS family permease
MTGELFPKAMRQTANSIFAIAGRLGAAIGVVLAGAMIFVAVHLRPSLPSTLAALADWRLSFLAAALFAPVGVLLMLTLPRQVAGAARRAPMETLAPSELLSQSLLRYLRRNIRLQLGFFVGTALEAFGMACVAAWIPIMAARYYHQSPAQGGAWLGGIAFGTGILGFLLGAAVFRLLRGRLGASLPILALAACTAIAAGCSLLVGLATSAPILYGIWALQLLLGMITNMVSPTLMQNMVPVHLRARMFAVNGLGTMVAAALSPPLVGVLSDRMTGFQHPLQVAVMTTSSVALVLSAVVLFASARSYTRLVGEVDATEAL